MKTTKRSEVVGEYLHRKGLELYVRGEVSAFARSNTKQVAVRTEYECWMRGMRVPAVGTSIKDISTIKAALI